jgi:hypothetical protein
MHIQKPEPTTLFISLRNSTCEFSLRKKAKTPAEMKQWEARDRNQPKQRVISVAIDIGNSYLLASNYFWKIEIHPVPFCDSTKVFAHSKYSYRR